MNIRRSLPSTLHTSHASEIRLIASGYIWFWVIVGIALAAVLPFVLSTSWLSIANQVCIAIIGALALNLLMGVTGQISLGHAGFIAAGAFTAAAMVTHLDAAFPLALAGATIAGAVIGLLVGFPALRLKGLYLAVSTLAAHFVIIAGLGQYQSSLAYGAGFTMPPPSLLGLTVGSERSWYFLLLPIAILVLLLHLNWLRSAFGRAWMAIHHRDISAAALGIDTARLKLMAFGASTAVTSFSGALWAYHTGFVSSEAFDIHLLIQYLAIVIIGGLGSMLGAILGSIFVVVLPHLITHAAEKVPALQGLGAKSFEIQIGVFGLVMLLFLIFEPKGLAGIWQRIRDYFQMWPFKFRSWES